MSYDSWLTTPPDDDPEGDDFFLKREENDRCPSCGARDNDPCEHDCKCVTCERRRDAEEVA